MIEFIFLQILWHSEAYLYFPKSNLQLFELKQWLFYGCLEHEINKGLFKKFPVNICMFVTRAGEVKTRRNTSQCLSQPGMQKFFDMFQDKVYSG